MFLQRPEHRGSRDVAWIVPRANWTRGRLLYTVLMCSSSSASSWMNTGDYMYEAAIWGDHAQTP